MSPDIPPNVTSSSLHGIDREETAAAHPVSRSRVSYAQILGSVVPKSGVVMKSQATFQLNVMWVPKAQAASPAL